MNVIWKFQLQLADIQSIQLPERAEILTVQLQVGSDGRDTICLWARLNPNEPMTYRWLAMLGTGQEFEFQGNYLATVQPRNGLVWHFFEVNP